MIFKKNEANKYDKIIMLFILSLGLGGFGGALQVPRVLAVCFLPMLLKLYNGCSYAKPIKHFAVCFVIYAIFSLLWTSDFNEGLKGIIYYTIHFVLLLEIIVFSRYALQPLRSISLAWTIVIMYSSIIAIWELYTGNHLSMAREEDLSINIGGMVTDRVVASAMFGNYNGYVTFLCFALPWIVYSLIAIKDKIILSISLFSFIMTIVTILIDGSRGGMFTLLVMGIVFLFFVKKDKSTVLLTFMLVGILVFAFSKFGEQIFLVLELKSDRLTSDESRIEIWLCSLKLLIDSLGFGVGVGGMESSLAGASSKIIPIAHNIFIEAFLQFGLFFPFIFFRYIYCLFKSSLFIESSRRLVVVMSIVALPFYGIINSTYLLGPDLFILIATLYIFVNYESIKAAN